MCNKWISTTTNSTIKRGQVGCFSGNLKLFHEGRVKRVVVEENSYAEVVSSTKVVKEIEEIQKQIYNELVFHLFHSPSHSSHNKARGS